MRKTTDETDGHPAILYFSLARDDERSLLHWPLLIEKKDRETIGCGSAISFGRFGQSCFGEIESRIQIRRAEQDRVENRDLFWTKRAENEHPLFRACMGELLRFKRGRKTVYAKVSQSTFNDVYREQFLREWRAWKEYFGNTDMNDL